MATPRKTPQKRVAAPEDTGIIVIKPVEVPTDRVLVFEYNGVQYSMPEYVPPALSLRALKMMRKHGEAVAVAWMLETMLGEEAYDVLTEPNDIGADDLSAVIEKVRKHMTGPLERNRGN